MSHANTISLELGEYRVERITIWDWDLVPAGTVPDVDDPTHDAYRLDLTGKTLTFTCKATLATASYLIPAKSNNPASGIVLLTQSGRTMGQADCTFLPADTSALSPGSNWYQVHVDDGTGKVQPALPPTPFVLTRPTRIL